jgi:hypothetical protein
MPFHYPYLKPSWRHSLSSCKAPSYSNQQRAHAGMTVSLEFGNFSKCQVNLLRLLTAVPRILRCKYRISISIYIFTIGFYSNINSFFCACFLTDSVNASLMLGDAATWARLASEAKAVRKRLNSVISCLINSRSFAFSRT